MAPPIPSSELLGEASSSTHSPDLIALVQHLHRKVDCQNRKIDAIAQQMDLMMKFNVEFTTTLSRIFVSQSTSGSEPIQFPTPPLVPDYPPDFPDEDDDNDD